MFAICIESSHSKGMGHLFRMLNFAKYLKKKGEEFLFVINNNDETKYILNLNGILFEEVDLKNLEVHWEERIIEKYNITFWVNDRLETDKKHSQNIKNKYVKLITLDDLGSGAELSDVHICGLFFNKQGLKGKKIFQGIKYLILNDEIDKYKKERSSLKKILVSLGGSDTYGVTITILKILKK